MKILHLTLRKEWFDRHLEDKQEDYRAITPYWIVRLYEWSDGKRISKWQAGQIASEIQRGYIRPNIRPKQYDIAEAKNGYASNAPKFRKEFIETTIGIGNPHWGAPEYPVFIIKLGKIIESVKPKEYDLQMHNMPR